LNLFENEEHVFEFFVRQNDDEEEHAESPNSKYLNHASDLKDRDLLESLFNQDDEIIKGKLGEEISLRRVQENQKVNIGNP